MQRGEQHFQAVAVVVVVAEYLLKTGFVQGTAIPEPIGDPPQIEGRECLASSLLQILLFLSGGLTLPHRPTSITLRKATSFFPSPSLHDNFTNLTLLPYGHYLKIEQHRFI